MIYALGFATKTGMVIISDTGEKISITKRKVGNMFQPDPEEFEELFLDRLTGEDIVLSPAGPNYTYLSGAYNHGATVFWMHTLNLEGVRNIPKTLLARFAENPKSFYQFQPQNERVAALALLTRQLLALERQRTADGNAYSQMLRRERDFFRFHRPDREAWITRHADEERRKFTAKLKKSGVALTPEQRAGLEIGIRERLENLYGTYFGATPEDREGKKAVARATDELVRDRMEWFGVDVVEAVYEKEVADLLRSMPENHLFDGLISEGTMKVRAEVLTYMRNPLLYPNAAALRAYASMNVVDGQAEQRRRGEASHGNPEFRRALCFDFGNKYWQNDTVGFFERLYYAYKAHQYYTYWELMEITQEVFAACGRGQEEDDERDDGDIKKEVSPDAVAAIANRLSALEGLEMIQRSSRIREAIADLVRAPSAAKLWRIFSRSPKIHGLNLQMTPKRIEAQTKRFLGITLLEAVYHRWMAMIGYPQTVSDDRIFVRRYQAVTGKQSAVPTAYDHEVVLAHLEMETAEMAKKKTLPPEVLAKFLTPDERKKHVA